MVKSLKTRLLIDVSTLIRSGWRNWQVVLGRALPFVALIDHHDWNFFPNRVLSVTILTNEPALLVKLELTAFVFNTNWAA